MKFSANKLLQSISYFARKPPEKYYHFEVRHPSPFKRPPLHQTMMLDDLKLMYLPIAKNACSSVKRIVAELGGVHIGKNDDIHRKLDNENTGILFVNRDDGEINYALDQPGWMRFVILRDPLDRIVSAYIEKFLVNRLNPGVAITCDPVLMRCMKVGWLRDEDYQRGITFQQFVEDIISQPANLLDPHWRPQSEYLRDFPYTHIYNLKDLSNLSHDLSRHIGQEVKIPKLNAYRVKNHETRYLSGAFNMLPRDLPNPNSISIESFLGGGLRNEILSYFSKDVELVGTL